MFLDGLRAALRILSFRAGPEDFPFDPGPRLSQQCYAFATLAFAAYFAVLAPPLIAVLSGLFSVGAFSIITRLILKMRKFDNRVQQTLNALLMTNGLLMLAMIPPFIALGPMLRELYTQLAQNPELLAHPEQIPQFPAGPALLHDILAIWQLAVCARIFGKATDTGVLGGVSILFLSLFGFVFLLGTISALLSSLGS